MTNYAFEIRFGVELEDGGGKNLCSFFSFTFFRSLDELHRRTWTLMTLAPWLCEFIIPGCSEGCEHGLRRVYSLFPSSNKGFFSYAHGGAHFSPRIVSTRRSVMESTHGCVPVLVVDVKVKRTRFLEEKKPASGVWNFRTGNSKKNIYIYKSGEEKTVFVFSHL
jgi:hypothetical protein